MRHFGNNLLNRNIWFIQITFLLITLWQSLFPGSKTTKSLDQPWPKILKAFKSRFCHFWHLGWIIINGTGAVTLEPLEKHNIITLKGLCRKNYYLVIMCGFRHWFMFDRFYSPKSLFQNQKLYFSRICEGTLPFKNG